MQTVILLIIILLMLIFLQTALVNDTTIGLYLTLQDYQDHKLSYVSKNMGKGKTKVDILFGANKVLVIQDEKTKVFPKNEVFGYRIDKQDYRFFNNTEYCILANKHFFIYSCFKVIQQDKVPKKTEQYYFSSNPAGPIQRLTIDNLESVYGKNKKFITTMDRWFKNNNQVETRHFFNRQYKKISLSA